ncbi:hypothetical protein CCR75_008501 [Bremia lactucae]|uniref:FYVE-type domain-containing protein n=1 Tax=Bremia lactucae TaxID=4779 RepID=A0A976FLX1_BRELC|nr:hypothetical protein CCR75_008501 [Bremia lactucae]
MHIASNTKKKLVVPLCRYQANKLQFPLPDDYFPPVSLSLSQVQQYLAQAKDLAAKAMELCRDHENLVAGFGIADDMHWQDVASDMNLLIERRKQGPLTITRTFGTVQGDFRRFINFFSSETSEELFAWNQFFFGYAVDAVALCNLSAENLDKHATLGIKWTCMQPSVLMRKRDECFLEYIVFQKDGQGRDAAVIVRKPINIPECPPLPNELKTKREKITTVMVVRESDTCSDETQLFMISKCDHKGLSASTKYCKKLLRALKNVSLSADAKRIATNICSPRCLEHPSGTDEPSGMNESIRPWVPTSVHRGCKSCSRPFRAGRRRRFCHRCGGVFCTKCIVQRAGIRHEKNTVGSCKSMASQRTFRVAQAHFCMLCVDICREGAMEAIQDQADTVRSSVASCKSSPVHRRSSIDSLTQPRSSKSSTPTSSVPHSFISHQADVPRHSATWSEENRNSWWSENESDACSWNSGSSRFSSISRNCSGAPTVRSSFSSEYSISRNSFMAVQSLETSCEIDTSQIDHCIDERSSIYEVIDTKDMMPESELQKQLQSQQSSLANSNDSQFTSDTVRNRYTSTPMAPIFLPTTSRRTRSAALNENAIPPKSLNQCIAEQNELLQQVLSASRGFTPNLRPSASQSINEFDDIPDDGVYEL